MLDTFEAQPLSDDDGNTNHLHQEEEDAAFNTKYLTSSNLMGLEVDRENKFNINSSYSTTI